MNRARQNTGVTADIREQIFPVVLFNKSWSISGVIFGIYHIDKFLINTCNGKFSINYRSGFLSIFLKSAYFIVQVSIYWYISVWLPRKSWIHLGCVFLKKVLIICKELIFLSLHKSQDRLKSRFIIRCNSQKNSKKIDLFIDF